MNFCVVGAGAWGTAFAVHLTRLGHRVILAPRRSEHATTVAAARENADYLPGVHLPPELKIEVDLSSALTTAEVILLACPVQALRSTCTRLVPEILPHGQQRIIVSLAKGLEIGTHLRPTQIIAEVLPRHLVGALTGPTQAAGVARGLPAAMVLAASSSAAWLTELQSALSGPSLRVYTTNDLAGVEYGGSLKNIYAIAAGCCDGLKLGDNAKSALLTRVLPEMVRVGVALGSKPETFYGLSGFGDLVATCHGVWSRNREFGQRIAEGRSVADLISNRRTVVEGYQTTESFAGLCNERNIDAPILREVHAILFAGKKPAQALAALMTRELKRESSSPLAPV